MGKRPSFIEIAASRLAFLVEEHDFAGPEVQHPWDRIPAIARVCYHRADLTIEVLHVVGFMGENHVQTRCHRTDEDGDWIELGSNTTRTGYQLRRALDRQAGAICSYLGRVSS